MTKIPGARFVVYRTGENTSSMKGEIKRVGMVHAGKVHMVSTSPGAPVINRKGRLLQDVEVLRDATPREVALGLVLHS